MSDWKAHRAPSGSLVPARSGVACETVRLPLPTAEGEFELSAFACPSGALHLVLVRGDLADGRGVLARIHSECMTGDALGSLRCDCGIQLRTALRAIAAEGRGVLIYAIGHEGRGVGLINKLRAYVLQDEGLDTVEANAHLGFAPDARKYEDAAACLAALGIRTVRLLTNNPRKVTSLRRAGVEIEEVVALATSAHVRNLNYLRAKERRMGHVGTTGPDLGHQVPQALDVTSLLGSAAPQDNRPYVVLKYAQTLDGRIATRTGDSKWISGELERRASHALRAACDGVLVGINTVITDNPQLTVRLVPGASPLRIVLDTSLRVPPDAQVLCDGSPTLIITSELSPATRRDELRERGIAVRTVDPEPPWGIDLASALALLREQGIRSLLVEGGAAVITSFLRHRMVDRIVAGIAPTILGAGTEAVGDLSCTRMSDGLRLTRRCVHALDDDVILAGDVAPPT